MRMVYEALSLSCGVAVYTRLGPIRNTPDDP